LQWIKAHPEEMLKLLERRYGLSGIVYILQVENRFSSEEIEAAIVSIGPSKKRGNYECYTSYQVTRHASRTHSDR